VIAKNQSLSRQFVEDVSAMVKAEFPTGSSIEHIGREVTLEVEAVDRAGNRFFERIRADDLLRKQNGEIIINETKFSSVKDLSTASTLRSTLTEGQRTAFLAITDAQNGVGSARIISVRGVGQNAVDASLSGNLVLGPIEVTVSGTQGAVFRQLLSARL
jgi:hypothetical protein